MSRWEWAAAVGIPSLGAFLINNPFAKEIIEPGRYFSLLKKPCYTPPSWVHSPVWLALYSSMGHASYLVWEAAGGFKDDAKLPLMLYSAQLIGNWFYIPVHVTFKKQGLNFCMISLLTTAVGACGMMFYKIDKRAGYFFVPYFVWYSFISKLQFDIWRLNKDTSGADKEKK